MSSLEVIQIVASCVRAFHNGADRVELLQARDERNDDNQRPMTVHERALADMLRKLFRDSGDAVSSDFQQAQMPLGQNARALQQGDDIAKLELLSITLQLQEEIAEILSNNAINGDAQTALDGFQALYASAMSKKMEAKQSIVQLQHRILQRGVNTAGRPSLVLSRQNSARSMARDFRNDAVAFSRGSSQRTLQPGPSIQRRGLSAVEEQQHLIPEIIADDIQSLAITDWDQDDRFTIAPEGPSGSDFQQAGLSPMQRYMQRMDLSSAASVRAALAPEPDQRQVRPDVDILSAGPYFPRTDRTRSHEDHQIPVLSRQRDRPSLPESSIGQRTDSLPRTQRVLSGSSATSISTSLHVSEPDSAISFASHNSKPYCTGAWNAQEDLIAGFLRDFLPTLPGSNRRELCWKCRECDFNFCDSEGQLLEDISFEDGVRYRFTFLARSHVAYRHPENAFRSAFHYGCSFCTAEGKRTAVYSSSTKLMNHIHARHRTNLTPQVRDKVRCVVGRTAAREEQWDVNLPDIGPQGGAVKRWLIQSVTGVRS